MSIPTYLILGSPTSGRCGIARGIISSAVGDDEFCGVYVSENEVPTEFDKGIASAPNAGFMRYSSPEDAAKKIAALDEKKFTQILFIGDSTKSPADNVEDFSETLKLSEGNARLARIWSVFDCSMYSMFPKETTPYFDALSHFADCVLLSRRSGVPNRDVENLKSRYEKMRHPHLFEMVDKNFQVKNPMEILVEEPRRISMFFDEYDPLDELDLDEENLPEEPFNLERKTDPYMERSRNGERLKEIPDVREFARMAREAERRKQS